MEYTLAIGDRTYSSWSLRGWLLFAKFGVPVAVKTARMKLPEFSEMLSRFAPAASVPAMIVQEDGENYPVWDSLAIAETLAQRHPANGFWPEKPVERAMARSISAEAHAGFASLRRECPMNLRYCYEGFRPSEAVLSDIERLEALWTAARAAHAVLRPEGPWLFGTYSNADVFFAPYATRIATYQLPIKAAASLDYVAAHLADQQFRQWRAMGLAERYVQPGYDLDLTTTEWPGPNRVMAHPVSDMTPINAACPFSGRAVAADSVADIDGRVIGFCNQFCRDKSVADAGAWPQVAAMLQ